MKRRRKWWKRLFFWLGGVLILGLVVALVVTSVTAGAPRESVEVRSAALSSADPHPEVLRVVSLNLAHGRLDGTHQLLLGEDRIRENLDLVVKMLNRDLPDLVALQEADGPSFWSGDFDHVQTLATGGNFTHCVRGENVNGLGLHYGQGLLSKLPMKDAEAIAFDRTPPTFCKGFLVAAVEWSSVPGGSFDLATLHLDFLSGSAQRKQALRVVEVMQERNRPLILMGDFNSTKWTEGSPLRLICDELGLSAWEPQDQTATFPLTGRRLDWILISEEFQFESHEVLPDVLSDHLPVMAGISVTPVALSAED